MAVLSTFWDRGYFYVTSGGPPTFEELYAHIVAVEVSPLPLVESAVLQSVVSRNVHGDAGTFDLPLSTADIHNPTTEPREGFSHTIVFTFDKALTAGSAWVTEGDPTRGTSTFSGNEMVVPLMGVNDRQYVPVEVNNVNSVDGGFGGSGLVRVGFLLGDVNQSRVVTLQCRDDGTFPSS